MHLFRCLIPEGFKNSPLRKITEKMGISLANLQGRWWNWLEITSEFLQNVKLLKNNIEFHLILMILSLYINFPGSQRKKSKNTFWIWSDRSKVPLIHSSDFEGLDKWEKTGEKKGAGMKNVGNWMNLVFQGFMDHVLLENWCKPIITRWKTRSVKIMAIKASLSANRRPMRQGTAVLSEPGGAWGGGMPPNISANQLTQSQPGGGAYYDHQITTDFQSFRRSCTVYLIFYRAIPEASYFSPETSSTIYVK